MPLDHIYGMLAAPAVQPVASCLEADYQKPIMNLFREIVQISLDRQRDLDALSYVQHSQGITENRPSWIPQWDEAHCVHPLALIGNWASSKGAAIQAYLDQDRISCRGVLVDIVDSRKAIDRDRLFHEDMKMKDLDELQESACGIPSRPSKSCIQRDKIRIAKRICP